MKADSIERKLAMAIDAKYCQLELKLRVDIIGDMILK